MGGGGYNHPNTARCWTSITALCIKESLENGIDTFDLPEDIPEHQFINLYTSDFTLSINEECIQNKNSPKYLEDLKLLTLQNINNIPFSNKDEKSEESEESEEENISSRNKRTKIDSEL